MWRNNFVHRVRLDHSQKTIQYVFGRCYENDLIYLLVHNKIFNNSRKNNNTSNVLMKVTGYEFL